MPKTIYDRRLYILNCVSNNTIHQANLQIRMRDLTVLDYVQNVRFGYFRQLPRSK
jgi:hypothetical protein